MSHVVTQASGYGAKAPASAPAASEDIVVAASLTPFVAAYPWSAGFGTKYSNPGTVPTGNGNNAAFGASDIAVAHVTTPFVSAYPWSAGFGTKYSNPGTLPGGDGDGVDFL